MAALLHDTVDDTRVSLEEIYDDFGPRVAQIVGQVGQLSTTTQLLRRRRRTDVSMPHFHLSANLVPCRCVVHGNWLVFIDRPRTSFKAPLTYNLQACAAISSPNFQLVSCTVNTSVRAQGAPLSGEEVMSYQPPGAHVLCSIYKHLHQCQDPPPSKLHVAAAEPALGAEGAPVQRGGGHGPAQYDPGHGGRAAQARPPARRGRRDHAGLVLAGRAPGHVFSQGELRYRFCCQASYELCGGVL